MVSRWCLGLSVTSWCVSVVSRWSFGGLWWFWCWLGGAWVGSLGGISVSIKTKQNSWLPSIFASKNVCFFQYFCWRILLVSSMFSMYSIVIISIFADQAVQICGRFGAICETLREIKYVKYKVWDKVQPSSWFVKFSRPCVEISCRDLAKRSLTEIWLRDLL